MRSQTKLTSAAFLATLCVFLQPHDVLAYGAEGLFGGRPQPDSSIVMGEPVQFRNDRPERADTVLDHPKPDYDPAPIEFGSFEMFPTLELGESYDDNIYANKTDRRDDMIGTVRPIINLFSNWNRHALSAVFFGDINYYSEHADENYHNVVVDMNGRYDIVEQEWIGLRLGYQRLTEQRSSPNAVNGSEPTTFGMGKAGLTFYRGIGQMKLNADYDIKRFDYDDTPTSTGVDIDQSTRDREEHVAAVRLGYDQHGNFQPYVRIAGNLRDYDHTNDHDSVGYDAIVGATADFGGITSLNLFAGWIQQYYDDFIYKKKAQGPRFGGRLEWNATGMTTVVLEMDRTLEETTVTGFNSFFSTGGSATLMHELRRNILLEGNFAFTRDDFNGVGERQDDVVRTGLGGRYLINRNLYTDLNYSWERRYSTDADSKYIKNVGTVRLGVRL